MGFTEDDQLKELCYEAIGEVFPGTTPQALLHRSRVWKIISETNVS